MAFFRVKIFWVGIGRISIPEFGQAQRLTGFCYQWLTCLSAQGLVGFHAEAEDLSSGAECVSLTLVLGPKYVSFNWFLFQVRVFLWLALLPYTCEVLIFCRVKDWEMIAFALKLFSLILVVYSVHMHRKCAVCQTLFLVGWIQQWA